MKMSHPFNSTVSFLDPILTRDGRPYGPVRYKEIVKECYILSKNLNTSYKDILQITPLERKYLIEMLYEESQKTKEMLDNAKREREAKRNY